MRNERQRKTKLKVWGIATFLRGVDNQVRAIVATPTRRAAADILGCSDYFMAGYAAETGNEMELEIALSQPGKVFYSPTNRIGIGYVAWEAQREQS
jgi:hypothetical protein